MEAKMAVDAQAIDWVYFDGGDAVGPGDLLSADAGGMPIYQVISRANGRAWLRDLRDGTDHVAPLHDFHWKATGAPL